MKCKACGREAPDGALFCPWCGKKIVTQRSRGGELKIPTPRQMTSGNWYIQMRIKGQYINVTEPTKRECIAKAKAIKAGLIDGNKKAAVTLTAAIDNYISNKDNVLSPSTIRGYRTIQRTRFKDCMSWNVCEPQKWQEAVNREAGKCSAKTLTNAWRFIRSVIKEETGESVNVALPQVVPHDAVILQGEEISRFCEAIKGTRFELAYLLALHSLRKSEILGLTWNNIDLTHKVIKVSGAMVMDEHQNKVYKPTNKNASSNRVVPILMGQLYDALIAAPCKEGHVVEAPQTTLRNDLINICRDNGLPVVTLHGLRHSFASLAAHLKIPIAVTQKIGGWSDDKVLKRVYTHLYDDDFKQSAETLAEFFNTH